MTEFIVKDKDVLLSIDNIIKYKNKVLNNKYNMDIREYMKKPASKRLAFLVYPENWLN